MVTEYSRTTRCCCPVEIFAGCGRCALVKTVKTSSVVAALGFDESGEGSATAKHAVPSGALAGSSASLSVGSVGASSSVPSVT